MTLFATIASATQPVICDPEVATSLLRDAEVDERRAPVTHPWLVPGLAAARGDEAVREALVALCTPGAELSVERGDGWEQGPTGAYALEVARVSQEGCSLVRDRVALTVGVGSEGTTYAVRGPLPRDVTPIGDCAEPAVWREERVVAGGEGAVRLVLLVDRQGDEVTHRVVVARRATAGGWREQVLLDPAPTTTPRLLEPAELVVSTGCAEGQRVWHLEEDRWVEESGRAAATRLARVGAWRQCGQEGWFLIVGQDDEDDADLVEPRLRRQQRRTAEPLSSWTSADFPELNPGYVFIAPDPYASRAEAEAASADFPRSRQVYVKRAWSRATTCGP